MQAVLYIEITAEVHFFYEKPILAHIRQHFPQVSQFDIDNHSDATLAGYAMKLLEQANRALVILDAKEGKTQVLLPLFEKILVLQQKCLVICMGSNTTADRYINLLADEHVYKQVPGQEFSTIVDIFFTKAAT